MTAPALPLVSTDPQSLVDALLYTISHDLRSPLLSMSLSVEILEDAASSEHELRSAPGAVVALDAMRHGAKDLERMIQALAAVSRARRRPLRDSTAHLRVILGGHAVISQESDLPARVVAVDPLVVREALDAIAGDTPTEVHARVAGPYVVLDVPCVLDPPGPSPLAALAGSLQRGAGGCVERLAVAQVLIERSGGTVVTPEGRAQFWLPLVEPER